jgi:hypothetical protein
VKNIFFPFFPFTKKASFSSLPLFAESEKTQQQEHISANDFKEAKREKKCDPRKGGRAVRSK